MDSNSGLQIEDGLNKIQNHFRDINVIYQSYMEESFELNNEINGMESDISDLVVEICNLMKKLSSRIINQNRLCIDNNFTIREGQVFRYGSPKKASNKRIFNNSSFKFSVMENVKDEKYKEKFSKAFNLTKFIFNMNSNCKFYSVVEAEYDDVSNSYLSEREEDESKNYYIIYKPKSSSVDRIKISYRQNTSKIGALEDEIIGGVGYSSNNASIKRSTQKQKSKYMKHVTHSKYVERAVRKSYQKVHACLKVAKEILNNIKDMFHLILVSQSI